MAMNFNEEEPIKTILTGVRLPRLRLHYFNHVVVSKIGNCIGCIICLDLATVEDAHARYARVCVSLFPGQPYLVRGILELGRYSLLLRSIWSPWR
ncbi:hypothetical protein LINPERHAP1_LOCUS30219 [Linum perenne]